MEAHFETSAEPLDDLLGVVPPEVNALVASLPGTVAPTRVDPVDGVVGNCIRATRIATKVLGAVGVQCIPLACDVTVENAACVAGSRGPDAYVAGVLCDRPAHWDNEPYRRSDFLGHLVVVGRDWFADLTAEQFHRPAHGVIMDGPFVGPYWPTDPGFELTTGEAARVRWFWRPDVKRWRTTPAWRQDLDRDTVALLVDAVRSRLGGVSCFASVTPLGP